VLATAVAFWQVILAVHIAAVVVAFGVMFVYPLAGFASARVDPRALPSLHRMQQRIGRTMVNPGLVVVLLAGIYLTFELHQWSSFFAQWGVAITIVLGGIEGAFRIPREGKLARLAERDLAAPGEQQPGLSAEYQNLAKQVRIVGGAMSALVLITIYLMTVQA
jgi:hypothetical protein